MRELPGDIAVGYIRSDLTDPGPAVRAVSHVAEVNGLEMPTILIHGASEAMPMLKLLEEVHRLDASRVITPAQEHLGGGIKALEEANQTVMYSGVLATPGGWHR
jgi:hypothetical protein